MEQRQYPVRPYPRRRHRSRGRRVLRVLERLLPLLLILVAALLSAGVVRVMEVRRPVAESASKGSPTAGSPATSALASPEVTSVESSPDPHVAPFTGDPTPLESADRTLEEVLRASVLDEDAMEEEPERTELEPPSTGDLYLPEDGRAMANAMAAVPEPGTLLLIATGIAWAARGRDSARFARAAHTAASGAASGATRRGSRAARCRTSGPHPAG